MKNLQFNLPSDLFKWCLINDDKRSDGWSYKLLFKQYVKYKTVKNYLWDSYDRRLAPVITKIKSEKKLKILEIGCGFGHDMIWAAQFGHQVVGVDVKSIFVEISNNTKKTIEKITNKKLNVKVFNVNLLDLDEEKKYDLIYMKDTFHHLEPREDITFKLSQLLKKNGQIVIIEPNALNPFIQIQMFRIRGFNTIIEKTDEYTGKKFIYGNERLLTGRSLMKIFKNKGLKGNYYNIRFVPTALVKYDIITKIAKFLENTIFERILSVISIHTIYIGTKEQ